MSVRRTGYKVIVPNSCIEVYIDSGNVNVGLENADNLQTFNCAYWTGMDHEINDFLNCLSDKKNLKTLVLNYAGFCKGEISGFLFVII